VTQILFDLGLPSFNTIMHNSKVVFSKRFCCCSSAIVRHVNCIYCRLYADCIMIMLFFSVSVSVDLLSLHILLFLWALSPELKRMLCYVMLCLAILPMFACLRFRVRNRVYLASKSL